MFSDERSSRQHSDTEVGVLKVIISHGPILPEGGRYRHRRGGTLTPLFAARWSYNRSHRVAHGHFTIHRHQVCSLVNVGRRTLVDTLYIPVTSRGYREFIDEKPPDKFPCGYSNSGVALKDHLR
ncbi:hypothetical protein AVEN_225211-1 [Araneus ventricosus]|uniref:Uncharacterized protein n=1 Tax=Araneus ventricosus TaxID=182803 RepID=A0A4Y2ALJ9_ARAVE|nr:hypothetical protein AVEN_225211-1 [Araneus ventricosus]